MTRFLALTLVFFALACVPGGPKSVGFDAAPEGASIELTNGRIHTDENGRTSQARIWAGGDCREGGRDLTVEAVEHGKRAAISIDDVLRASLSAKPPA